MSRIFVQERLKADERRRPTFIDDRLRIPSWQQALQRVLLEDRIERAGEQPKSIGGPDLLDPLGEELGLGVGREQPGRLVGVDRRQILDVAPKTGAPYGAGMNAPGRTKNKGAGAPFCISRLPR